MGAMTFPYLIIHSMNSYGYAALYLSYVLYMAGDICCMRIYFNSIFSGIYNIVIFDIRDHKATTILYFSYSQ